jgi:hypothetical protein
MARLVTVEGNEVVVRLDGWSAVAALKRKVTTPLAAVRHARAGRFDEDGWRLAGTHIPFTEIRGGRFRRRGRRQFLSFSQREQVLILEAERSRGAPYDVVAVEVPDAATVAALVEGARSRGAR